MAKDVLFPQGIEVQNADGSLITLSMKEATLRNLFDVRRSYTMCPTPEGQNLVGGGLIRYRIPILTKSNNYSNSDNPAQNVSYDEVYCQISNYRHQGIKLNQFDFSMLVNGGQLQAQTLANMQESIICDKNKYFFDGLKAFFDAHPEKTCYFPELTTPEMLSTDAMRTIQKFTQWKIAELSRQINNKYVGVKPSEFFVITDAFAGINVNMLLSGLNASSEAFREIEYGKYGIEGPANGADFILGGIPYINDNFMEQYIPANFSFNDAIMDLSNYNGFVLHPESVGFPFGIETSLAFISQKSLQPEYHTTYCFGFKVIRPELVLAYVKDLRTIGTPAMAAGDVKDVSAFINVDSRFTSVSLATSSESVATVSGSKITAVGVGTCNITVTVGDESKTFELTVSASRNAKLNSAAKTNSETKA